MLTQCTRLITQAGLAVAAFIAFGCASLRADDPPPPSAPPASSDAQSTGQQPPPNASPVTNTPPPENAAGEGWVTGFVDAGYQWQTGVGGNNSVYRSIVDLGSGPKLLDTEFTLLEPSKRFFDRVDVRAYDYGDQPYTTLHVSARKAGAYDFELDHRDIAYFNNIPEWANQYVGQGLYNSEMAYDIRKKLNSFTLDLFPNHFIVPFFAYDRNADNGTGISGFSNSMDFFTVPDLVRDSLNNYRAGIRFNAKVWHATMEIGGNTFKDDEQLYTLPGALPNFGNESRTAGGRPVYLGTLSEVFGVRNDDLYARGNLTANLTDWMQLYAQFLFSRPRSNVDVNVLSSGNLTTSALAFTNFNSFVQAFTNVPHTSGSVGAELFPRRRFRGSINWLTDLQQVNGNSAMQAFYYRLAGATATPSAYTSELRVNYSELDANVYYDVSSKLTLRGGYRFIDGNSWFYFNPADGLFPTGSGTLRQNIGIGGIMYHPNSKLRVNLLAEAAPSDSVYFRTSLYRYQKANVQVHYQLTGSLNASLNYGIVNNTYPVPGVSYGFRSQQASGSLYWTPNEAKRFSVLAEYTKSLVYSNIFYLNPVNNLPIQSRYTDNADILTGLIEIGVANYAGTSARLTFGGSLLAGYGSEPTKYYQPLAKLVVPLNRHVAWISNWTYYGYNQNFLTLEGFRTHLVVTGIRLSR